MYFIYLCVFAFSMCGLGYFFVQADAGREMSMPPTNAFSKMLRSYDTVTAKQYDDIIPMDYPYAQISDSTTQSCISGSAKNVTLNTNDSIYRITHSTTARTNEIGIQETGVYQVIAVPQVGEATVQADGIHDFWMMKNNMQIPNSNIKTTVMLQVAISDTMTGTLNWVGRLDKNDIISFQQGCTDSDIGMVFTGSGIMPATPSIIISIAKIS